jgi:hypothetical protein
MAPVSRFTCTRPRPGVAACPSTRRAIGSNLGLDLDYPRLNEWQAWWAVEPGLRYAVCLAHGSVSQRTGEELAAGFALALAPGMAYQLQVCGV